MSTPPIPGGNLRWRFPHPSEEQDRRQVLGRIDSWWSAFAANAARLAAGDSSELAAFVQEHLTPVDPRLAWEVGPEPAADAPHVLAVTAETRYWLQPLIDVLLSRAPALPGWRLTPFRLARPLPLVEATVKARVGVEMTGKWTARAWKGQLGTVHVLVSPPLGLFRSAAKDRDVALVALEALLGEEIFHGWIGHVEAARRGGTSPLAALPASVAALLAEADSALPAQPWSAAVGPDGKVEFHTMELQPRTAADYAAQDDLRVGSTFNLELWRAQHLGPSFRDRRFSRAGETHCYLKLDGSELTEERDRGDIEDAILVAAEAAGLGLHIPGGGTGLRYSYIDFAITDVPRAIEVVRPVLREQKVPRRSWFLFWDERLAAEWIPVWDDAPPPPRVTG